MSEWVREALTVWGIQTRRILLGGRLAPKPVDETRKRDCFDDWIVDGYASQSIAAKNFDARGGAVGCGASSQHYDEVLSGDALLTWRAMFGLPERLRKIAYVHYVVPKQTATVKAKFPKLGYANMRAYYDDIDRLHIWVEARYPDDVSRETNAGNVCAQNASILGR